MKSHDQVSVEAKKRKNDEIDETFNMFAVAHVNVHSQLVERSEIEQSEQYYKDEYDEIQLLYKRVNLLIENVRLQQAEERLTVKSELAECYAREKVFAEAEAAERGASLNIKEPLSRTKSTSMKHEQSMSGASNNLKSENRPYEDNSAVLCETKRQLINSVRNREINPLTLNDLFIQQQTNAMALALPKPSVPLFGGNAME
jgi:hypothetical protein